MNNIRKIFTGLLATSMALTLTVSAVPAKAAEKTFQLGHVNTSADDDQYQYYAVTFADKLSELSGGTIAIDIITDSVLGGERDMFEGMQMGTVDMALITNFSLGSFDPEWEIFDLPYMFRNRDEAYSILDDDSIMDPMEETLYNNCGVKTLGYGDGGFRHIVCNGKPINNADDLNGMKIRLPETAIYVDAFKAMGANPTTLAFSETFTAVEQGTVDGLELPISSIHSTGYAEICEYMSLTGHFYSPFQIDMASYIWDGLTEEEQGWFLEAAAAATEAERIFVQEKEQEFIDEMAANGLIVNEVDMDSLADAASAVYDSYRDEIGADLMDTIFGKLGR